MPNYVHYIIFCIILYPILKVNTAYYISFILLTTAAQQADVSIEQSTMNPRSFSRALTSRVIQSPSVSVSCFNCSFQCTLACTCLHKISRNHRYWRWKRPVCLPSLKEIILSVHDVLMMLINNNSNNCLYYMVSFILKSVRWYFFLKQHFFSKRELGLGHQC